MELAEEADELGIEKATVVDFNNFSEESFPTHKLAIVCAATHYEGDPTDNSRAFYKWLKKLAKNKEEKPFSGMKYTVFGLGDTSYEQYNEMGIQFDKLFEQLGGTRAFDLGAGNAETFSTETDFEKWKENLWSELFKIYAEMDTPEQAEQAQALRRRRSTLDPKKPNVLPWLLEGGQMSVEEMLAAPAARYDLNMRNYEKSVAVPIKSIR